MRICRKGLGPQISRAGIRAQHARRSPLRQHRHCGSPLVETSCEATLRCQAALRRLPRRTHMMSAKHTTIAMKAHPRPTPEVKELSWSTASMPVCSSASVEQSRLRVLTGCHHARCGPPLKHGEVHCTRRPRRCPYGLKGGVPTLSTKYGQLPVSQAWPKLWTERLPVPSNAPAAPARLPQATPAEATNVHRGYPHMHTVAWGSLSEGGSPHPSLPEGWGGKRPVERKLEPKKFELN